jgi:hypothetical protein
MNKSLDNFLGILIKILLVFFIIVGVYGKITLDSKLLFFSLVGLFGIMFFGLLYLFVDRFINYLKNKD